MRRVIAILITYHPDDTVIDSIQRVSEQVDHVVVVDNSVTEQAYTLLTDTFSSRSQQITLIFNSTNQGVATALNLGAATAITCGAEWVLTMDQDSQITSGMVATMLATYETLPPDVQKQVASLTPTLTASVSDIDDAPHSSADCADVPTAITSGNLVKTMAWQAIGGFNERLFIDYVDHEFCFRLRRAGWKILECPKARLVHKIGNAVTIRFLGRKLTIDQHPPLRMYYIARNGFYFWRTFPEPCGFTRTDQINTFKLFLKTLLVDTHKCERLLMFWRGYCDFRKNRFGSYATRHAT